MRKSLQLENSVAVFKAARWAWPQKIQSSNDIDTLQAFRFLYETNVLENLKKELPVYLTKAADWIEILILSSGGRSNNRLALLVCCSWKDSSCPAVFCCSGMCLFPTSKLLWFLSRCFPYGQFASFNNVAVQQGITELLVNIMYACVSI